MSDEVKERRMYMRVIWISLYGVFITLSLMIFFKKIRGTLQLILSSLTLLFSILIFISVLRLLSVMPIGGEIIKRSVGLGIYLAMLGGLGLIGEQLYFYNKRNDRGQEQRLIDELE